MGKLAYMDEKMKAYVKYRDIRMTELSETLVNMGATNYLYGSDRKRLKDAKRDVMKVAKQLGKPYEKKARRELRWVTVRRVKREYALTKAEREYVRMTSRIARLSEG